ncbi:OrfA [Renibacterium salmoninarum ATCC 33209]|uniref:OrfA n=1 Tax=Renibacterium salmoninarum (strain ATCC 33209 / DSM 20767 / JCM 11484 / NBRC 15589 / NCIMB 2235) TaxID=288705 RepID=A9WTG7_RENSM|nr:OrfA [Renibacterium salmoninarum ATCC 33209]
MAGKTTTRYPQELKDRTVRMVAEMEGASSEWAAMQKVAQLLGVGVPETVRKWVRQAEIDVGTRTGTTSTESAELKRANAILRSASAFFAVELDRHNTDREIHQGPCRSPRE